MCDVRVLTVYKRGGGGLIQQCGLPKKKWVKWNGKPNSLALFFLSFSLSLFESFLFLFVCLCGISYRVSFFCFYFTFTSIYLLVSVILRESFCPFPQVFFSVFHSSLIIYPAHIIIIRKAKEIQKIERPKPKISFQFRVYRSTNQVAPTVT